MRVAGIVPTVDVLVDGRPGLTPDDLRDMVYAFRPRTVPILSAHDGVAVGRLDELAEDGQHLRFVGYVSDTRDPVGLADGAERSISPEIVWALADGDTGHPERSTQALADDLRRHPHFGGTVSRGANLVGVAFTAGPAAPGSLVWRDEITK